MILKRAIPHASIITACTFLVGCAGSIFGDGRDLATKKPGTIQTETKFSEKAYGVAASDRIIDSVYQPIPRGGGYRAVGVPYKIKGRWFRPKHQPNYDETGIASWYGPNFHGRKTANGEIYDQTALSAAHPTLPMPSYVRVTNPANKRSVIVRVNDRGPFVKGRIIDLSYRTAELLNTKADGLAKVRVQYVGPAPLDGDDEEYLEASYRGPGSVEPSKRAAQLKLLKYAGVDLDDLEKRNRGDRDRKNETDNQIIPTVETAQQQAPETVIVQANTALGGSLPTGRTASPSLFTQDETQTLREAPTPSIFLNSQEPPE